MKHYERFSVYTIRREIVNSKTKDVEISIHKTFMRLDDALEELRNNGNAFDAEVNDKDPDKASLTYRVEEFDTTIKLTIEKIPVLY